MVILLSGLQLESDPKVPSNFPRQPQPTPSPSSQTRQSTTSSNPQISQVVGASGEALVTATPTEISTGELAVEASVTETASGPSIANPSPSSAATAEREETPQDDSHLSIDDLIVFHPSFPGENTFMLILKPQSMDDGSEITIRFHKLLIWVSKPEIDRFHPIEIHVHTE